MRQEVNDRSAERRFGCDRATVRAGTVRVRVIVTLVGAVLIAAGGLAWTQYLASTPGSTPLVLPTSGVRVEGSKRVDLGSVPFIETAPVHVTHEIILRNGGEESTAVENMAFSCRCLSASPELGEIPAGGTWSKTITLRVEHAGRNGGSVYLVLSDGAALEVVLSVEGIADPD